MRLRAFLVGPFQWRIRDGKWELHFEPRQILVTSGATGVVPGARDFPRWRQLCMLVAGVTVNALTGCIALRFAYLEAARGAGDVLALFGAFSLVAAGMNLLPFRIPGTYSDGAQIYQILSRGAWADFHAVVALAGASLVTSVRPRDCDIDAIHSAAAAISQGTQGLLLQLLAHSYFLDRGELEKAGEELARAAKVSGHVHAMRATNARLVRGRLPRRIGHTTNRIQPTANAAKVALTRFHKPDQPYLWPFAVMVVGSPCRGLRG